MKTIITTSPVGMANLSISAPGRLLPVVLTDIFNELHIPGLTGHALWNTGLKTGIDDPFKRYEDTLRAYSMYSKDKPHYFDNDPAFHSWVGVQLMRAIESGTITLSQQKILVCSSCDGPQAFATAPAPVDCANCGKPITPAHQTRNILSMPLAHHANELSLYLPIINKPSNWSGQLASMPQQALISKKRKTGVPLNSIGLNDLKLDPRVSNALFPIYLAEKLSHDRAWAFVGLGTLNKVAPFNFGFRNLSLPPLGYIGLSKMPANEVLADPAIRSIVSEPEILRLLSLLSLDGKNWSYSSRQKELLTYSRRMGLRFQKDQSVLATLYNRLSAINSSDMSVVIEQSIASIKSKGPAC